VTGDLKDPQTLNAACAGVDAVITTANSMGRGGGDTVESVDRIGNANLVDAAAAEGIGHFVFTSVLGASPRSPMPFTRARGETEERLRASGIPSTVLQPDAFMDTWIPPVVAGPALAGQPVTIVGEGRRRHSFVAMRDVAAYAVAALDHPHPHRAEPQSLAAHSRSPGATSSKHSNNNWATLSPRTPYRPDSRCPACRTSSPNYSR
jgi:NADH dehydrogenase